jgi:type IV pilus assembly protein PilA
MKSDLQVKFLSFMTGRKKGEGFTLIELLVVIIIIGILAAIALPSFLNQANKAKQSEAKQYVSSISSAEQTHYLEQTKFTTDFNDLAKVVKANTTNYSYTMAPATNLKTDVNINGITVNSQALRSYISQVKVNTIAAGAGSGVAAGESTTVVALCETLLPSDVVTSPAPEAATPVLRCPGMKEVGS